MSTLFRPILTLTTLCLLTKLQAEVYWPEWLGPNRDGRVTYFDTPAKWPDSVSHDWSLTIGEGSAMPIIANGSRLGN